MRSHPRCDRGLWSRAAERTESLTRHAQSRMQQRSIPNLVVDLVLRHGHESRRLGASVFRLDKAARRRIRSEIGSVAYRRLEDLFDIHVVLSDEGTVITAAHRLGRMERCDDRRRQRAASHLRPGAGVPRVRDLSEATHQSEVSI
jgi:hypothetical protein